MHESNYDLEIQISFHSFNLRYYCSQFFGINKIAFLQLSRACACGARRVIITRAFSVSQVYINYLNDQVIVKFSVL